jgi:hypothetical protein
MAINTEWAISRHISKEVNGFKSVVTTVFFSVFAYDDVAPCGKRGRIDDRVDLSPPTDRGSFFEPGEIDRARILSWVKDALGLDGVAAAEKEAQHNYITSPEPPSVTW